MATRHTLKTQLTRKLSSMGQQTIADRIIGARVEKKSGVLTIAVYLRTPQSCLPDRTSDHIIVVPRNIELAAVAMMVMV